MGCLIQLRTRGFSGPLFQRCGNVLIKGTGGAHHHIPDTPGYFPWRVSFFGDIWTQETRRNYSWATGVTLLPFMAIAPVAVGHTYRITGNVTVSTGALPSVLVSIGYLNGPYVADISATGLLDVSGVCGDETPAIRFLINDRDTNTAFAIEDLKIEDLGVVP